MKRVIVYNKIDLSNQKKTLELIKALSRYERDKRIIGQFHLSTKQNVNLAKLLRTLG